MPTLSQGFIKPLLVIIGLCLVSQAQVVFTSGAQMAGGVQVPIGVANNPPLTGAISYNMVQNSVAVPTLGPWVMSRYNFVVSPGGKDFSAYRGANNAWLTYFSGCCIYAVSAYPRIFQMAALQGFSNPEGAFLHVTVDYTTADTFGSYDQFDYAEMPTCKGCGYGTPTLAAKGVFTYAGGIYADKTVQSYCPGPGCPSYTAAPYAVTSQLYFGSQIPFDTANFTINASTATGVTYQYWNGSTWANFTPTTDTTSGMTTSGQIVTAPPPDWTRTVVNGSQSKYWWRVTLGSGSVTIGRLYGVAPKTGTTAWGYSRGACVSGLINVGTDVEYCGTPGAGHSARFLQQSRAIGGYDGFWLNPSNKQGGRLIGAYLAQAATTANLQYPGENGIMFDNSGVPPSAHIAGLSLANTDFDSVTFLHWQDAAAAVYQATHTLLTTQYGSSPKWWDGSNVLAPYNTSIYGGLNTAMNWTLSENLEATNNALNANTAAELWFCNNPTWCPGLLFGNHNPGNSILLDSILSNQVYGVLDGAGTAVSNHHLWDMADRDPMMALAMFWIYRTDNVAFMYNTVGSNYFGVLDDYYHFVTSAATLNSSISPAVCSSSTPCSIPLSQALGVSCPSNWEIACTIRIGGKDVVKTTNYTGTTLSVTSGAVVNSYPAGATIEYVKQGNQSMDSPLNTPIYLYGSWFPAMALDLGTPDGSNGFNYPCNGATLQASPGCLAVAGLSAKGTTSTCNNASGNWCSPLLRRDFSGGPHGYTVVLVRPASYQNRVMAPTEYDVPGALYSLPSPMYQLHADGSFTGPVSLVTLKGGEAGVFVSY